MKRLLPVALIGLAMCSSESALSARGNSIESTISRLTKKEAREKAFKTLDARRSEAIPVLTRAALNMRDPVRAGWAVVALERLRAKSSLDRILKKGQTKAQKTWAAAARIKLAADLPELVSVIKLARKHARKHHKGADLTQLLQRPIAMRTQSWPTTALNAGNLVFAVELIDLHPPIAPWITASVDDQNEVTQLVTLGVAGANNQIRARASGLAGTLMQQRATMREVYAQAIRFNGDSRKVPWKGGALYVPNLGFNSANARPIIEELFHWYLLLSAEGHADAKKVAITLSQMPLQNTSFNIAGKPIRGQLQQWLLRYRATYGRPALRGLLAYHDLERDQRFSALLR